MCTLIKNPGVSCAGYSIPNSTSNIFFGYVIALKIYLLPVKKRIYIRKLTIESNFISNDLRINKKLKVLAKRTTVTSVHRIVMKYSENIIFENSESSSSCTL